MNKIVLENTRDVPLTTDLLAFMQASYSALEKLAAIGGDNFIVSGCTVSGSTATSGWMVLKGKLVPFTGGSIRTNVRIITTENVYPVGAGSETEIVYTAEFGTSSDTSENVPWADIKRPNTTIYLSDQISTLLSSTIPGLGQDINAVEDRLDLLENVDDWFSANIVEGDSQVANEYLALRRVGNTVEYAFGITFNNANPTLPITWELPDWAIPRVSVFSSGVFHKCQIFSESLQEGEVKSLFPMFYGNDAHELNKKKVKVNRRAGTPFDLTFPHTNTGYAFNGVGTYLV